MTSPATTSPVFERAVLLEVAFMVLVSMYDSMNIILYEL